MPDKQERKLPEVVLDRRSVLQALGLGASGLAAAALIGCGGDDDGDASSAAPSSDEAALKTTDPRPEQLPAGWVWDADSPFPTDYAEPDIAPKAGGTFNIATSWDVGPFDPVKAAAGGSITVPNTSYNRLLGFAVGPGIDQDRIELQPELAASRETTPDGLTHTFTMQPNAKWQNVPPLDGRAFVAEDAKYAFERYKTEGVYQTYWINVTNIEAVDPSTLRITLSKPIVDFLYPLGGRYQTIFPRETVDNGTIETAVIGTGPWILREAVTGTRVRFDKNPDYWETDLWMDGIEYRPTPDASARLAAFRAGQVEYAYSPVTTKRDVDELISTNPDVQVTSRLPDNTPGAMPLVNHENPKWQDVRVRRAFSMAIDREALSALVFENLGRTLTILPWAFAVDEAPTNENGLLGEWARYAPDEAKKLLQAAGQEEMTVEAPYFEYALSYTQIAEIYVDQLRQVGISYQPKKLDYTEYNSQLIRGTFPDALHWGYVPLGFEADTYFLNGVHSESPGNRDHMSDPEIDQWAEAQQVELDPDARRDLHRKIWDKYHDQMYRQFVTSGRGYQILQPWVRGMRLGGPLGIGSSFYDWGELTVETWLDK